MAQKLPKMAQNYPKWPKNDARTYALFLQFFLTEKAVPQTFSLLECMDLLNKHCHSHQQWEYTNTTIGIVIVESN